jgi:hypothetical protein
MEVKCVEALLAAKADPNLQDKAGCTPLVVCVSMDPEDISSPENCVRMESSR